jgi:hypothetical protein
MKPTNPIVIDGKTYDLYTMTLATASRYNSPDQQDASVVLTLTPTRFEGDQVEQSQENNRTVLFGSLASASQSAIVAVDEVSAAIQKFIYAEGL